MPQKANLELYITWKYKFAKDYEFYLKMAEENPSDKFEAIEQLPDLSMLESYYAKHFSILESSRQSGMGVGSIPLSEILSYKKELDEDSDFIEIIQHMDSSYLKNWYDDPKNKTKGS